ncbi:hypothetical protein Tco_0431193 [Tanacetum coccineum]
MQGTKLQIKTGLVCCSGCCGRYIGISGMVHFRGTMPRGMHVLGCRSIGENVLGQSDQDSKLLSRTSCYCNASPGGGMGAVLDEESDWCFLGEQVTNFDDDVDDPPEQDLALNVDHVFEADQLDAFDSDVDEAPTTHTMLMANLTSEDPIFNEARTSYYSNIPFEVQDHDNYHDSAYGHHDVHEMQNNIQQDYVVDFEADYTSDSNTISYD